MDKTSIKREMQMFVGGGSYITVRELSKFLGQTNDSRVKNRYLRGLERIGKSYFIPDVAERLNNTKEVI